MAIEMDIASTLNKVDDNQYTITVFIDTIYGPPDEITYWAEREGENEWQVLDDDGNEYGTVSFDKIVDEAEQAYWEREQGRYDEAHA